MPRVSQRRKGKPTERPRLARGLSIDEPVPQGLRREFLLAVPLKVTRDPIVTDEVAREVVSTSIYQHSHTVVEQRSNVQRTRFMDVAAGREGGIDSPAYQ